jgi:hypothetical protein
MVPMPLPHWLTRVNLVVTNRLTMPLAGRLPWFGVMEHVGRRSGAVRWTPLNVFPAELVEPRRFRDPRRGRVPVPVRWALGMLRVDWFVELRQA